MVYKRIIAVASYSRNNFQQARYKMRCPYCYSDQIKVLDSRESSPDSVRRRRECEKCGKRFTTYERIELIDLRVIKKDGAIEEFNRNKLLKGILRACEKRPIKMEKIERLVDEVAAELRKKEESEIPSKSIGEMIIERLKQLDKVAYIRFASVYREFADISHFQKELKKLGAKT